MRFFGDMISSMKKHVNFTEFAGLCYELAQRVKKSGNTYDRIVCVARGGMLVGDILSRILKLPLSVIVARSYDGGKQGDVHISDIATVDGRISGQCILLVDDMADSGLTLKAVQNHLLQSHDAGWVDTAVLWVKPSSVFEPNYYAVRLADNPWIVMPFEEYDQIE